MNDLTEFNGSDQGSSPTYNAIDAIKRKLNAQTWNKQEELILQIWAEKASGWAWLHDKAQRYYSRQSNLIMYPCIILSTFTGGAGFLNTGSDYVIYSIACLNIIVGALVSFQKFLRPIEIGETHARMFGVFSSFTRKISLELTLNPEDRKNCIQFCKICKMEYDKAVAESPMIPDEIINRFKREFPNEKNKPEVANGLFHFTNFNSGDVILNIG